VAFRVPRDLHSGGIESTLFGVGRPSAGQFLARCDRLEAKHCQQRGPGAGVPWTELFQGDHQLAEANQRLATAEIHQCKRAP
jgi:hypothetical protein